MCGTGDQSTVLETIRSSAEDERLRLRSNVAILHEYTTQCHSKHHGVCGVARPARGGSLSEITEVCEAAEGEMEDSGDIPGMTRKAKWPGYVVCVWGWSVRFFTQKRLHRGHFGTVERTA